MSNIIQPNEFEHGLMLGMMLINGKKKSSDGITDVAFTHTSEDGSIIKTWVEKTYDQYNSYYGAYYEAYGIFQERTSPDGTVEKVTIKNDFTTRRSGGYTFYLTKEQWIGWELCNYNNLTEYNAIYYYLYGLKYNTISRYLYNGFNFKWQIPIEG